MHRPSLQAEAAAPAADAATQARIDALPDKLRALAARGLPRHYRKGTLLIQEGDSGDTLYLILAGRLRAFGTGRNGREVTYGVHGAGEYIGEMSLDGGPRSASVETLEASCCVVITRETLLRHIAERPDFALDLLAKVIRRARAATLSAKQMALEDVYGRLVALLDELAGAAQADGSFQVTTKLTHHELAQRLGCSREMVSKLMKDLERGGHLEVHQGGWRWGRPLPGRW